jgi:hypothetical protein
MSEPSSAKFGDSRDHLTVPGRMGWRFWRDAVLRSAGLAIDGRRSLGDPVFARHCERWCIASAEVGAVRARLREFIGAAIDEVRATQDAGALLKPLQRAMRDLQRADTGLFSVPPAEGGCRLLPAALLDQWRTAAAAEQVARGAALSAFDAARGRESALLADVARDPFVREAVGWQNHCALTTALDPLARGEVMSPSRRRQRELLVANYLQRYAFKNDTIGFFGPMAWVRLEDDAAPTFRHGAQLVRSRTVRLEDWPVVCLAARLAEDDGLADVLVPRRPAFMTLERNAYRCPGGGRLALDSRSQAVVGLCDGRRSVAEITRRLLVNPLLGFDDDSQVLAQLRSLQKSNRLTLDFGLPTGDPEPGRLLRSRLERVADPAARRRALAALSELEKARDDVVAARGSEGGWLAAMVRLDDTFARLSGHQARRRAGQTYGGRALIYEDAHRDVDLVLGRAALESIRAPLELVLTACRWFTCEAAKIFEARFRAIVDEIALATDAPGAAVPFPDFWLHAQDVLFGGDRGLGELARELRDRWEHVLADAVNVDDARVQVAVDAIRDRVSAAFPSSGAGWTMASHHSPDVMFCANDPQALLRGDFTAVLGEVHVGGNTLATNLFVSQHPKPDRLRRALRRDLGEPYPMPKLGAHASGTPIRTQFVDDPGGVVEVLFSLDAVAADPASAVRTGDLQVVQAASGELVAVHPATGRSWPLTSVLGDFLSLSVQNEFGVLPRRAHTPRVTIGGLVVQRERWVVSPEEMPLSQVDEAVAHLALLRWCRERGMPSSMFVKVPWEDKPFLLDLSSAVLVRGFLRQLRLAPVGGERRVSMTEMLPGTDELWLQDAAGRRYTSELRLVAIHDEDVPIDERSATS